MLMQRYRQIDYGCLLDPKFTKCTTLKAGGYT